MEILDNLITDGFIGDYTFKRESYSGDKHIVRVAVTEGLTLKGQDRREWPDEDGEFSALSVGSPRKKSLSN